MKILCIAGARPNFIKIAPLHKALERRGAHSLIVHTGQHYDPGMSGVFFQQLDLPKPACNLGVSEATHTRQTARVMLEFEEVLRREKPDLVLVVGDVNSTLACALTSAQAGVPVAHVEAGLRSGDRSMPEEINRILTDQLSDYLFVSEQSGLDNLAREGFPPEKIHLVGNVMIDTLVQYREKASALGNLAELGLKPRAYALLTLHRPSNVDNPGRMKRISALIEQIAAKMPVVFPIHPRTAKNTEESGALKAWRQITGLHILAPQGYLEFLNLLQNAFAAITDSGGVQEETAYLQIPCLTLRENTERPVTLASGANRLLAGLDLDQAYAFFTELSAGKWTPPPTPPLWDGRAAERIGEVLLS